MIRFTCFESSAETAMATARYVLPVPPGPMAKTIRAFRALRCSRFWLGLFGVTLFLPNTRVRVGENAPWSVESRLVRRHLQQGLHFLAVRDAPVQHALVVGVHDAGRPLHLLGLAFDFKVVVFQVRPDLQGGFEIFQVFIEGAEELVDSPGNSNGLLHQVGGSYSNVTRASVARLPASVKPRSRTAKSQTVSSTSAG